MTQQDTTVTDQETGNDYVPLGELTSIHQASLTSRCDRDRTPSDPKSPSSFATSVGQTHALRLLVRVLSHAHQSLCARGSLVAVIHKAAPHAHDVINAVADPAVELDRSLV
jgi:hypothetical protein